MKFKAIVEIVYDISDSNLEDYYETTDPNKCAAIDQTNLDNDPTNVIDLLQSYEYTVKVEPVK